MPPARRQHHRSLAASLLAALAFLGGACGDDTAGEDASPIGGSGSTTTIDGPCDTGGPAATDGSGATVNITLDEYTLTATPQRVPAGPVLFVARNGGLVPHELTIVRFDGDPGKIPLNPFGGADEAQLPEGAIVGWIESFDSGRRCSGTFDLAPGRYALICNVVDDGSNPHYSQGMYTGFTVA